MKRFPDGARVCFVGDSLVAANQYLPRIIDHYNKYFPEANVRFFNCGTSGGSYKGSIDFFRDDVLVHNPTHVVLAFGINDSGRDILSQPRSESRLNTLIANFETFKKSLSAYAELVLSHGIKLTLCTPAPYDEYTELGSPVLRGAFALMVGYSDFVRTYAERAGADLFDNNAYLTRAIQTDAQPVFSPDRVHPNEHGYYLIAKGFLEHQGLIIDDEAPIPKNFANWHTTVRRLRVIYGAEHMLVRNYSLSTEEKIAKMEKMVEEGKWSIPVLENFARGFIAEKRNQDALYKLIDELYESEVLGGGV